MTTTNQSISGRITVNTLPDDVLVDIFYFYVNDWDIGTSGWHALVHVCQRWRYIVLGSPRRLNLRLVYRGIMSEMQDIWPALPVAICPRTYSPSICENITAFLDSEHRHRICAMLLFPIPVSHWERFAAAMQKPIPELTDLEISVDEGTVTSPLDAFLGGSASRLRRLVLGNCPFRGLPKLLLSAHHLVVLSLWHIPYFGYFSPQALVTALSVMSRLESLYVGFHFSLLRPDLASPPPLTRSVLPSLTRLVFRGVHEYLEDLLAQIEVPLLNNLDIFFFMDFLFAVPQLYRLISQTESFKTCHKALVYTSNHAIRFSNFRETRESLGLSLATWCRDLNRQLSLLAQLCSSSLRLSTLVQLDIVDPVDSISQLHQNVNTSQWLELLELFTAVKDLRLANQVAPHVCRALDELAEGRVAGVLPALQNIFLGGLQPTEPVPKFIEGFVAARQLSGHPVAVYPWRD
ncbi:hypothetical protein F5148DRAFT_1368020 [Russula earlei]|uniref:Uncharacterized protein n=1 Tax=Russula earlei TaxID=71964 RepID=A0ACC0U9F3_9AGAM|nr:hypothetical protein F5148DRAFT_1368020 [Russula earlei]